LGVALLFLAGVGPVIAWRRASPANLRRAFAAPVAAGAVAALALAVARVPFGWAFATFALSAFVLGTVVQEFWRGVRARQATLAPEKRFYKRPQQPTTEVAMRSTLAEDLYLVLGSYDAPTGLITLQAYVNPLVAWLWIGGFIMAGGTIVTMWPSAAERREAVA